MTSIKIFKANFKLLQNYYYTQKLDSHVKEMKTIQLEQSDHFNCTALIGSLSSENEICVYTQTIWIY